MDDEKTDAPLPSPTAADAPLPTAADAPPTPSPVSDVNVLAVRDDGSDAPVSPTSSEDGIRPPVDTYSPMMAPVMATSPEVPSDAPTDDVSPGAAVAPPEPDAEGSSAAPSTSKNEDAPVDAAVGTDPLVHDDMLDEEASVADSDQESCVHSVEGGAPPQPPRLRDNDFTELYRVLFAGQPKASLHQQLYQSITGGELPVSMDPRETMVGLHDQLYIHDRRLQHLQSMMRVFTGTLIGQLQSALSIAEGVSHTYLSQRLQEADAAPLWDEYDYTQRRLHHAHHVADALRHHEQRMHQYAPEGAPPPAPPTLPTQSVSTMYQLDMAVRDQAAAASLAHQREETDAYDEMVIDAFAHDDTMWV